MKSRKRKKKEEDKTIAQRINVNGLFSLPINFTTF